MADEDLTAEARQFSWAVPVDRPPASIQLHQALADADRHLRNARHLGGLLEQIAVTLDADRLDLNEIPTLVDGLQATRNQAAARVEGLEARSGAYLLAHDHLAAATRILVASIHQHITHSPAGNHLLTQADRDRLLTATDTVHDALSRDLSSYLADPDDITPDTRIDLTPAGLAVTSQPTEDQPLPKAISQHQPPAGQPFRMCQLHGADCRAAQNGRPCSGMPAVASVPRVARESKRPVAVNRPCDPGYEPGNATLCFPCSCTAGTQPAASGPSAPGTWTPLPENWGPYENELQTRLEPMPVAVNELHDAGLVRSGDPDRVVRDVVLAHLVTAAEAARVELGAFDRRILEWLARGELSTAQVVIGLIRRAFQAGHDAKRCYDTLRDQATMEGDDTIMVIMVPSQNGHPGRPDLAAAIDRRGLSAEADRA